MKRLLTGLILATLIANTPTSINAGINEDRAQRVLSDYVPDNAGYLLPTVKKVTVSDASKTIKIDLSESASYLPLTTEEVSDLKADIRKALGTKYATYKISLITTGHTLDELASDTKRKIQGPTETTRFITREDQVAAPKGLDGDNIALWQSHGWYFEPSLNRWEWQRARIFETVEDLYTQSYVMPYLMPMLENAGAYVMSPRERDTRTQELIIDNDNGPGYKESNGEKKWKTTSLPGFGYKGELLTEGVNPFKNGTARMIEGVNEADKESVAQWCGEVPENGDYAVYVSYQSLPNSATDVTYTVNAANGPHKIKVNQKMGGGTWIYLGHFPFKANSNQPLVTVSNLTGDKDAVVSVDAVKIGGGIGNVARIVHDGDPDIDYEYVSSKYPRFTEGARYFLQWAGAPDSVYTPNENVNDYKDDYMSRPLWVNWITGGSSMLPDREGLKIPVDLAFAFHSDAGTTPNDSIIGTLGIYMTQSNDGTYANGTDRLASRDLTNAVMTNIVDDVRDQFEPNWTRRGMWDKSYAEARIPEVPTMLLELLSHQNFADMKYGLDPAFRFTVSRAIYKGMLQFLANRDGREYVVQPLPVRAFAINGGANGKYTLTWSETVDSLEETAHPTYYLVQEREEGGVGFRDVAMVVEPRWDVTITDNDIHSYRIVAGNEGGVSFPSEILALCYKPGAKQVLVVNGFTRVSAPDWFDSDEIAGFYNDRDGGVPYMQDISLIGQQFEFRRDIPWMDDDSAGFGASRSNYETQVVAGNTFDYPALHGDAIKAAGYGFISSSVEAFMNSGATDQPKILDLILGKQKEIQHGTGAYGTYFKTFPSQLQNKLRAYTQAGGCVMVTGSFVATDLWDNPHSSKAVAAADQKFAQEVLGYCWRVGQASVTGEVYEVQSRYKAFDGGEFDFYNELNPDMYAVESPDSFYAPDKAKGATIMRYTENNLVAGTAYNPGRYRTVVLGFPFESIRQADGRNLLMRQILKFLDK
ncbi:MAG: xanthan lyase [Bacteroidales bacterium]|nr:xanthan lyase [Bacteroidales bacterium]